MTIRELTCRPYRIPLRRTFETSARVHSVREGVIVRLMADSGLFGLGEIAPLSPQDSVGRAFRRPAQDRLLPAIQKLLQAISGVDIDAIEEVTAAMEASPPLLAAVRCGLDIAACDLLAKHGGVPLADALGGRARMLVPVNATIAARSPEMAAQAAAQAVANGFRCVKLKVGMRGGLSAEVELVSAVRSAIGPATLLRLDANQAWEPETAVSIIRSLERFDLEFVEQPVPAGDIEALAAVRRSVSTPIAADESVTDIQSAKQLIAGHAADLFVIKPMIVGGLRPARAIIELAEAAGLESVVTTTIDSGVGVAAALHLAATFTGKRACGIATGDLLESDLISPQLRPRSGMMKCPDGLGLGVEIDEIKSAPYLDRL